MTRPTTSEGYDPDLLRRLKEFQGQLRRTLTHREDARVVPIRSLLSRGDLEILAKLATLSSKLAESLEQALTDLNDSGRLTYVGPAGEAREVMRAAVQLLAPDDQIRKQPWFVGVKQGNKTNPTQSERVRYAVQRRGGDYGQAAEAAEMVDERIGRVGRLVYQRASASFHSQNQQKEVRILLGYVFALLDDVLPD